MPPGHVGPEVLEEEGDAVQRTYRERPVRGARDGLVEPGLDQRSLVGQALRLDLLPLEGPLQVGVRHGEAPGLGHFGHQARAPGVALLIVSTLPDAPAAPKAATVCVVLAAVMPMESCKSGSSPSWLRFGKPCRLPVIA